MSDLYLSPAVYDLEQLELEHDRLVVQIAIALLPHAEKGPVITA